MGHFLYGFAGDLGSTPLTGDYLYLNFGLVSHATGATVATSGTAAIQIIEQLSSHTTANGMRIYYNSIGEVEIFTKKGRYIIQIRDIIGRVIRNVAALTEERARKFADAMVALSAISAKKLKS